MRGYKSRFGVGTLSLALGKLYTDPFVIYREYIQNACDGLELAIKKGLIKPQEAVISIQIDSNEISIKDRGVGVSVTEICSRLVDPGNSVKYKDNLIGQYGIGRLIAAQYCEKIVFETSFFNENKKSILTWDTKEAFRLIESHEYEDATDVIDRVTHFDHEVEDSSEHYFRVRLCGITRRNDQLVNVQKVKEYVSLIAPIDYSMEFKEGYLYPALDENPTIKDLYKKERIYKVIINDEDIRKPYTIDIPEKDTSFIKPLFMTFEDPDDGMLGWGWYALNEKIIQMNSLPFRGIRFRKLNTAVGDSNVMAKYMKNVSVNYFVGEIFLTHENIQPTGSRDGFVDSEQKAEFDALTVEDMMQAKFRMPLFIRSWQCMNNTNSINIPNDDIVDDILNSVYSPYHTMKWCLKQQELALRNFDLNMAFYESLDGEKFNREIDTFQKEHFEFRKVTDLNEYKGVSGIYIMVLDEYKQIYIGITKSKQGIKGRIGQHWSKVKPLDRLIFGGVERSILSIDSFRQFDTTRIFAFPSDLPFEELKDLEHELVEHSFSSEFLCNRTKGGGESLEQAIIERKDRTLT